MNCGESTIDGLLAGIPSVQPLAPGAAGLAVGYLQDLLRGHGYSRMPDPRLNSWGTYGRTTSQSVADYRRRNGLPPADSVDASMLTDLVRRPASNAAFSPAYITLTLGASFHPIARFIWLTSLFETGGAFGTLNLNTDKCGLSFGVLQWSQRSGQLHNFFETCYNREPAIFEQILKGSEILGYTARPNGGLNAQGLALDPKFELTKDPWKTRLQALGVHPAIQRVQVELASNAYSSEFAHVRTYAAGIRSERAFAFLLDLANQFGGGRVARQYQTLGLAGEAETDILKKLEDAFTNLAASRFQPQVRARREFFRTTTLLSDQPFDPGTQLQ